MRSTFLNLPQTVEQGISELLARQDDTSWIKSAQLLHDRYMAHNQTGGHFIHDFSDVLAYLGMRVPATYAQHAGALTQLQGVLPSWKPRTLLDLGAGPGTGIWTAKTLFPSLASVTAVEQEADFVAIGKQILASSDIQLEVNWHTTDAIKSLESDTTLYDLVIIGNVLNELSSSERSRLVGQAYNRCRGVLLVLEPGTPSGADIVQAVARSFEGKATLLAPYINNSFVTNNNYYLHFPQRFIRPEFERRVRQHMRNDSLSASDWEEAKYAYVALGKMKGEKSIWGRCVGPIEKQKGFLLVPVLTAEKIETIRVMKRYKEQYNFARELVWGQSIEKKEDLLL